MQHNLHTLRHACPELPLACEPVLSAALSAPICAHLHTHKSSQARHSVVSRVSLTVSRVSLTVVCWWWHRSDGLESLQESQQKKQEAASAKGGSKEAEGKPPRHNLNWTAHLLAACRKDELDKLEKLHGVPRCVAMYRLAPYTTHTMHVDEMKSGNVHMTCVESETMRVRACVMMHRPAFPDSSHSPSLHAYA